MNLSPRLVRLGGLSLGPTLLGLLAQGPQGLVLGPAGLALNRADARVLCVAGEEVDPVGELVVDLLLGGGALGDLQGLEVGGGPEPVDLGVVAGQVHLLDAAQVGGAVVGEAARHEAARRVHAREHVVRPAGAVRPPVGRHVVDGPVDCEVDGLLRVGAVVGG